MGDDELTYIYIGNANSYNGKYITWALHNQGIEIGRNEKNEKRDEFLDPDFKLETRSSYKIFGSLAPGTKSSPCDGFESLNEDKENFNKVIKKCSYVIYDISLEDATQITKAKETLSKIEREIVKGSNGSSESDYAPIVFILVSTTMTWGLTQNTSFNISDPIPFSEEDYANAQPHPNFKEHYQCERYFLTKADELQGKLKVFVLCSGITYGYEEGILTFFFKRAWNNDEYLPIFGDGSNFIPLIHVHDLASIISKIVQNDPLLELLENHYYILAIEQIRSRIGHIIKLLSRKLGSGRIKYLPIEEAFLYPDVDQFFFDHLNIDLPMDPILLTTLFNFEWKSLMNLPENMDRIIEEFRCARDLKPLRIVVNGPPCSGKNLLAHELSEHYNLHHISVNRILAFIKTLIEEREREREHERENNSEQEGSLMSEEGSSLENTEESDITDDEEDAQYQSAMMDDYWKLIPKEFVEKPAHLSDEQIIAFFMKEMSTNHSKNQGFILDNFPETYRQTIELFQIRDDVLNSVRAESDDDSVKLLPTQMIILDAPNDFLLDRVSRRPEQEIQEMRRTERELVIRFISYRENNVNNSILLDYFERNNVQVIRLNIAEFPLADAKYFSNICIDKIGQQKGFKLEKRELEELELIKQHQEELEQRKKKLELELENRQKEKDRVENMEIWFERYNFFRALDDEYFEPRIEKLREYVSVRIITSLGEAIVKSIEEKADDHLDFIAKYLFKNNDRGKMYNPRYTRDGKLIIKPKIH